MSTHTNGVEPASAGFVGSEEWNWTLTETAIVYTELDTNFQPITMGNPLEFAWEILPFSFVFDLLIPVGDWLSAMDALKGYSNGFGSVSRKRRYQCTSSVVPESYLGSDTVECELPGLVRKKTYSRDVISLNNIPLPNLPGWDPSKSHRAVVNMLALLKVQRSQRAERTLINQGEISWLR
jgi:hypothetical protein